MNVIGRPSPYTATHFIITKQHDVALVNFPRVYLLNDGSTEYYMAQNKLPNCINLTFGIGENI